MPQPSWFSKDGNHELAKNARVCPERCRRDGPARVTHNWLNEYYGATRPDGDHKCSRGDSRPRLSCRAKARPDLQLTNPRDDSKQGRHELGGSSLSVPPDNVRDLILAKSASEGHA